jgi:hypothetical protein
MSMDIVKTEPDSAMSGDEMAHDNGEEGRLAVPLHEAEVNLVRKCYRLERKLWSYK